MERIYMDDNSGVSLWFDNYDTNGTPYVIKVNGKTKYVIDCIRDAYRIYNDTICEVMGLK